MTTESIPLSAAASCSLKAVLQKGRFPQAGGEPLPGFLPIYPFVSFSRLHQLYAVIQPSLSSRTISDITSGQWFSPGNWNLVNGPL